MKDKKCSVNHLCLNEKCNPCPINVYWYNPKRMTLGTLTLNHDYKEEVKQLKKYWNEKS